MQRSQERSADRVLGDTFWSGPNRTDASIVLAFTAAYSFPAYSRRSMGISVSDFSPDFISSGAHDAFVSRCADQGLIFASFLASAARATRVS